MFGLLAIYLFSTILSVAAANLGRKKSLGASFQVPTTPAGTRIPVVYGTWRVRPITTWFGGVKINPVYAYQTPKLGPIVIGAPQSQQVGYEYEVTMMGLLCWGPAGIANMVFGDKILLSDQSATQAIHNAAPDPSGGDLTITGNVITAEPTTFIDFWFNSVLALDVYRGGHGKQGFFLPSIYGEPGRGGGVKGKVAFYMGDRQYGPDETMNALIGTGNVPSYGDVAYVVYDKLIIGESATPNPIDYILRGRGVAANYRFIGPAGKQWRMEDTLHSDILLDALTNRKFGKNTPEWQVNRASFEDAAEQLFNESLGGSMCVGGQTGPQIETYEQLRDECERTCGGKLRRNPETFQWEFKLLRDESGIFEALPHYDEDDLADFEWQTADANEVVNEVTVVYSDAELLFERATVTLRNDANIATTGQVRGEVIEYLSITRRETALQICARDLKQRAAQLGRGKAKASLALWRVLPGDVIRVSNAKHRLDDVMMRVLTKDDGTPEDSAIGITFAEDVFGHSTTLRTSDPTPPVFILPTITRPVVQSVVQSETAGVGTTEITVLDTEHRIVDIAFKTKSGASAESAWVSVASASADTSDPSFPFNDHVTDGDVTGTYSRTVALSDAAPSTVRYRVQYIAFSTVALPLSDVQEITGIVQFRQLPPSPISVQALVEANPIIWDVTDRPIATGTVTLTADRTLDIVGEVPGFQGTLLVSTSAPRVLTLPENSLVSGGTDNVLNIAAGHSRYTVTYDGVRFWWMFTGLAEITARLAAAVSSASTAIGSLTTQSRLAASVSSASSATAALGTSVRLAASVASSSSAVGTLTDSVAVFPTSGLTILVDIHDSGNRTLSGSEITQLVDSISGNTFIRAYSTGPTLVAASLNGYDIARFASARALWDLSASGLQAGDLSMFVVAQIGVNGGIIFSSRFSGGCSIQAFDSGGSHYVGYEAGSGGSHSGTETWSSGAFDIMLLTRESGNWTMYRNGTSVLTGSTAMASAGTRIALGFPPTADGGDCDPDIALAGLYDHALDSTERASLFGSLGAKYAITVV